MEDKENTSVQTTEKRDSPLDDLWRNLAALVKVKTIVTLVIVGVFANLALRLVIQSETLMTVVSTVIAFYFGTQSVKKQ